jgi:hypothetical protein
LELIKKLIMVERYNRIHQSQLYFGEGRSSSVHEWGWGWSSYRLSTDAVEVASGLGNWCPGYMASEHCVSPLDVWA